jgi:CNT family concentrative nucleoside transporter
MSGLNLISLLGLAVMLLIAWCVSSIKSRVDWRLVGVGLLLQFLLAVVLFQSQTWTFDGQFPDGVLFAAVDGFFKAILFYVSEGSGFMFGINGLASDDPTNPKTLLQTFAFGVLPTVVFFSALMSILYHLGVMQLIIQVMAWGMRKTLGTTGPESLAAAANVLVGHTEAPLVIKPYVAAMTRSELNALMVGGFSTISGSLMAIFVSQGISAGHILSASIISAPAALVIAKIMQPEIESPAENISIDPATDPATEKPATNVIEAAAIGASDGMKLAINIAAILIAFLAMIALMDGMIGGIGEVVQWIANQTLASGVELQWSLSGLFGCVFYPLAWLMGIEAADCGVSGNLLGKKMVVNEFVAYYEMSLMDVRTSGSASGEASQVVSLSDRSKVILTYALCGFSNFGAIGIQIGGIGSLAPQRRSELAQLGLRAMFGGVLACCMTACMAGILYGVLN